MITLTIFQWYRVLCQTLSIYGVPGGARCALAGELTSLGPQLVSLPEGSISSGKIGSDVDDLCSLTGSPQMKPENLACELLSGRTESPMCRTVAASISEMQPPLSQHENVAMFGPQKPHALVCNEIQGGNREFIGARKLPGMEAWVATIPVNEKDGGGDLHFMSVCDGDLFSRVALADVSGHGRDVDAATMVLHRLMRKHIGAWDQSDFMRGLNDTFSRYGGGQYATAIVLSFNRITGHLAFSNAGHLPPLWYHASQQAWGWLEEGDRVPRKAFGLPVGLIPGTDYCQTVVMLGRSDLLVLYTDGITDAGNARGKDLGRAQLLEWARQCPVESPEVLGEELLKRVGEFRGSQHNDDETLVVLRRQEEPTLSAMVKVAWSNTFGRLLRRSL